jgi:hypothetical protein
MKNITVSVNDEVYYRARVRAAERRTTVSALVRGFLEEVVVGETHFERLLRQQNEVLARIIQDGTGVCASERLTRDEVHDRHAVR